MARKPGLTVVTKSIPLTGGTTEGVPEELTHPPGMAYMENARFRKIDQAEKTLPLSVYPPNETTGASHFTPSTPFVMWSDDAQVATLGRNEVARYQGDGETGEWIQTPYGGDGLGIEKRLGTGSAMGGIDYSWAPLYSIDGGTTPYTRTLMGYIACYMRISYNDGSTSSDGVFELFDKEGNLLETEVVTQVTGVMCRAAWARGVYSYCDSAGAIWSMGVVAADPPTMGTFYKRIAPSGGDVVGTVLTNYDPRLSQDGGGNWVYDANVLNGRIKYEGLRPGFNKPGWSNSLAHYKYKAHPNQVSVDGTIGGAWAWIEGMTSQALKVVAASSVGGINGSVHTVASGYTTAGTRMQLFDVDYDQTYIYVLWAVSSTTSATSNCTVKLTRITISGGATTTNNVYSNWGGSVISGACCVFQDNERVATTYDGDVAYAFSAIQGEVDDGFSYNDENRVFYGVVTGFTTGQRDTGSVYYARVASDIVIDKYDAVNFVMQQWGRWSPQRGSADPGLATMLPTKAKGVTSCLTKFDVGATDGVLIGTIDAGQSKVVPFPRDEVDTHLNSLFYVYNYLEPTTHGDLAVVVNHDFWVGNRIALTSDDALRVLKAPNNNVTQYDGNKALSVGAAQLSVYRLSHHYITYDFEPMDDGFIVNTAVPMWYDGANMMEAMVPDQPEIMEIRDVSPGVSEFYAYDDLPNPDPNSLFIQVICGFYDQNGTIHRSAPSFPVYVGGLKGDYGTDITEIDVKAAGPPATLSAEYFMEFYIGEVGEEAQLAATNFYEPGTFTVSTISALAFTGTLGQQKPIPRNTQFVYTTGDTLAADPWPSFKFVYSTARRVFAVSTQAPGTVYYSKLMEENVSPEFSGSLVVSVGTNVDITAMGGVDDKVLLFTKDSIYVMYGTGPDNTGANGDFFVERVNIPLGCTDNQSVVTGPDGVSFFSSTTGRFHTVTRDLQVIDIGESVRDLTDFDLDVVYGLHVPTEQEIRWYIANVPAGESQRDEYGPTANTDAGTPARPPRSRQTRTLPTDSILAYNYVHKKWTALSDQALTVACMHKGNIVGMAGSTWVAKQNSADAAYRQEVLQIWETPWLKVNLLQDFGRFRKATILGKYLSEWDKRYDDALRAGDLDVEVLYDYEEYDLTPETHTFRANVDLNDTADGNRLQFVVPMSRQKCQAIKFRIKEVATVAVHLDEPTYTIGRGYDLTGLDLTYGLKPGSGDKTLGEKRSK